LYSAVLFYSEAMYPLVWTIGALGAWMEVGRPASEEVGEYAVGLLHMLPPDIRLVSEARRLLD